MPSDKILIPEDIIREMIRHSREVYPEEACGILAGNADVVKGIYRMTNIEHSTVSYLMDSREQFRVMKDIREKGLEMIGIYHSHTFSEAYPSQKDINLAFYDVAYLIVSLATSEPVIKAYRILDQREVREMEILTARV